MTRQKDLAAEAYELGTWYSETGRRIREHIRAAKPGVERSMEMSGLMAFDDLISYMHDQKDFKGLAAARSMWDSRYHAR